MGVRSSAHFPLAAAHLPSAGLPFAVPPDGDNSHHLGTCQSDTIFNLLTDTLLLLIYDLSLCQTDTLNLIEGLTPEDKEWLRTNGNWRDMAPNEMLIREGETLREIYFVLGGLFSVGSMVGESFSTVGPGGILGDMSLLTEKAASASVMALEPGSAVLAVPRELIAAHLTADPGFAVRFYRLTATLLPQIWRSSEPSD